MHVSHFRRFLFALSFALVLAGLERAAYAQTNPIVTRAQSLRSQHRPAEAAALLQPYTEQHPDDTAALILLGNTLLDLQQTEQAGQAFVHALAVAPNSIPANLAAGEFLLSP